MSDRNKDQKQHCAGCKHFANQPYGRVSILEGYCDALNCVMEEDMGIVCDEYQKRNEGEE